MAVAKATAMTMAEAAEAAAAEAEAAEAAAAEAAAAAAAAAAGNAPSCRRRRSGASAALTLAACCRFRRPLAVLLHVESTALGQRAAPVCVLTAPHLPGPGVTSALAP
jgi:hypothetical protein